MRALLVMLRHSGRYSAASLALFLSAWHAYTVTAMLHHLQDKFAAAVAQSSAEIDAAVAAGDIVTLRNVLGRLAGDGVPGMDFRPAAAAPADLAAVAIGARRAPAPWLLDREVPVRFNGADLGSVRYQIDLARLNAAAARGNTALYAAVTCFMLLIAVLANAGTLVTLARIEQGLKAFAADERRVSAGELKAFLDAEARKGKGDPVSRSLVALLRSHVEAVEKAGRYEGEVTAAHAMAALASQVAHDIRSPLAALRSALDGAGGALDDRRSLAESSLRRIGEIADGLLARYRDQDLLKRMRPQLALEPPVPALLRGLIDPLVAEKRAQFADRPRVRMDWSGEGAGALRVLVQPAEFERLLSNLLNNAVEAIADQGRVAVEAEASGAEVVVRIRDDGRGIPPDVLARLKAPGETHGKAGGSGLGVAHAAAAVAAWGGRLEIESEVGRGTVVSVHLPRADPPAGPAGAPDALLLDDDPLVRMNWVLAARRAGKRLDAYSEPGSLLKEAARLPKDVPIYIDSQLADGAKGEDVAAELARLGFSELHLETGEDPASFGPLPHIRSIRGKESPWADA